MNSGKAERIPLNTLAIGFGVAGLAECWSVLVERAHGIADLAQIGWIVAALTWLGLLIAHGVRGFRTGLPLVDQLRHPAQGPLAALVPATGMLLGADLFHLVPVAGRVLVLVAVLVAVLFAAWLVGIWFEGSLELEAVHGGYLLPTVATGLIGALTAAEVGVPAVAWAMFGIGGFFGAVMTTLLILRLTIRPSLPDPLAPTIAVLLAPPAVAGSAWSALTGGRVDPIAEILAGLTVLSVLIQLGLLPRYRRLTFSLGFWSFTFPLAAVVVDATLWLSRVHLAGWQPVAGLLVLLLTAFDVWLAVRSLALLRGSRTAAAERALEVADDIDAERVATSAAGQR